MDTPLIDNIFHVTDQDNRPVPGGQVYTYEEGTTNPKTTYSDEFKTPNTNPVILNSAGRAKIYGTGRYTVNILDSWGGQVAGWPKIIDALPESTSSTMGVYFLNNKDITDHGAASGTSYINQNLKWVIDQLNGLPGTVVIPAGDYMFITALTTPSNLNIIALNGATLHIYSSLTLGSFKATMHSNQIFYVSNIDSPPVYFSESACSKIYASWFGSVKGALAASGTTGIPVSVDGSYSISGGITMVSGGTLTADYTGAGVLTVIDSASAITLPAVRPEIISVTQLIINMSSTAPNGEIVINYNGLTGFNIEDNIINMRASNQYGILCSGYLAADQKCVNLTSTNQFNLFDGSCRNVAIDGGIQVAPVVPLTGITLSQFVSVNSENGYLTFPNRMTIQWGKCAGSEDVWAARDYVIPFVNAFCVVGNGCEGNFELDQDARLDLLSPTQFRVATNGNVNVLRWVAIGIC